MMMAAEGLDIEEEQTGTEHTQATFSNEQQAPLQNYFTLPFALHLRPLPHVSFLAESAESSDAEFNDGASYSSEGGNFRAGTHQLRPSVHSVPPHSLSTISTLLEHTQCLEAIPIWTSLITLLDKVDDDPHFTNLRQFFDVRFDSEGRLVRKKGKDDEKEKGLFKGGGGGAPLFGKRGGSFARRASNSKSQSPSMGGEEGSRSLMPGRSRSKSGLGHSLEERDEDDVSSVGADVRSQDSNKGPIRSGSQQRSSRRKSSLSSTIAPEIYITRYIGQTESDNKEPRQRAASVQPIRFRIRLDLHNIGLAPPPPRIPTLVNRNSSMRSKGNQQQYASNRQPSNRIGSSPDNRLGELRRVTSLGASSECSYADGTSLRPVTSPDSVRSQQLSEGSHSDEVNGSRIRSRRNASDTMSTSPAKRTTQSIGKQSFLGQPARTMTGSSATTNLTSDYGTSPDTGEEGFKGGRKNSNSNSVAGSKAEEGKRRPSIIHRLMGMGGRKGSGSRKRSTTAGSSNFSNASIEDVQSIPGQIANSSEPGPGKNLPDRQQQQVTNQSTTLDETLPNSPTMIHPRYRQSFSALSYGADGSDGHNRPKMTDNSDWSNEEALDTADDEGSIGSSSGWGKIFKRRGSSSGALPSNLAMSSGGTKVESELLPVHEEKVFDRMSVFSGNYHDDADIEEEDENEGMRLGEDQWPLGSDFLSLLRLAAEKTLHLKKEQPGSSTEGDIGAPKSSSTAGDLKIPIPSVQTEEKIYSESLLAPFLQNGHEENPDSWWLCGSADPLPISFACALSQSLGWKGVMELCYGKESRCDKSGTFASLGKAAEMNGKLQDDSNKVRNWAQDVSKSNIGSPLMHEGVDLPEAEKGMDEKEEMLDIPISGREAHSSTDQSETVVVGSPSYDDDVGPSESASVIGGGAASQEKREKENKLAKWISKMPGRNGSNSYEHPLPDLFSSLAVNDNSTSAIKENRTWQDWADLLASIGSWMEEYETCRVRNGLAREVDREPPRSTSNGGRLHHPDSGFIEGKQQQSEREKCLDEAVRYSSIASYQVPRCVILDALESENGFRRRHGIPEGLSTGPDGQEHDGYRWARSKLSSGQFATPLLLATSSLSYFFGQLAASDWTFSSAWELDYLEMCVFHSDIISTRYPSPSTNVVPFDQVYQPEKEDVEGTKRAMTCPYPHESAWDSTEWQEWLTKVKSGMILVPAVSWQAWWTLIAVLNGADGSGRALDLQVKAVEEPFSALDDLQCIYI